MAESSEEKKEEKFGSGRWWEFYFVRYALGTVFGILIVNFLAKNELAIPFPKGSIEEITKPDGMPLLIGYGLAYCYFASAPILVFHSARFSMKVTGYRGGTVFNLAVALMAAGLWVFCALGKGIDSNTTLFLLTPLAILMITFLFLSQGQALLSGINKTSEMWDFYRKLDRNRRVKENRELVESYRHLREHGNAFFVVCLEILLGLGIYITGKVSLFSPAVLMSTSCAEPDKMCSASLSTGLLQTMGLLIIWIVPAAFVWTIACLLEKKFADDEPSGATTAPPHAPSGGATPRSVHGKK